MQRPLVECCFTCTKTVGLLGTGTQDGHLDLHTAPVLYAETVERHLFLVPAWCLAVAVVKEMIAQVPLNQLHFNIYKSYLSRISFSHTFSNSVQWREGAGLGVGGCVCGGGGGEEERRKKERKTEVCYLNTKLVNRLMSASATLADI